MNTREVLKAMRQGKRLVLRNPKIKESKKLYSRKGYKHDKN